MTIADTQAMEWIEKIGEKNELIAVLKAQLEAMTSERDYLRSLLTRRSVVYHPDSPWLTYGPVEAVDNS